MLPLLFAIAVQPSPPRRCHNSSANSGSSAAQIAVFKHILLKRCFYCYICLLVTPHLPPAGGGDGTKEITDSYIPADHTATAAVGAATKTEAEARQTVVSQRQWRWRRRRRQQQQQQQHGKQQTQQCQINKSVRASSNPEVLCTVCYFQQPWGFGEQRGFSNQRGFNCHRALDNLMGSYIVGDPSDKLQQCSTGSGATVTNGIGIPNTSASYGGFQQHGSKQHRQWKGQQHRWQHKKVNPATVLLLLPLLMLLLGRSTVLPAAAQMDMPFQGSGEEPPAVPAIVHVSSFVDRLLNVNDDMYEFEAVTWIYLSWRDPRTRGLIEQNEAKLIEPNSTYVCSTPCQSNQIGRAGGCCDGVWTPYIAFTNIKWLPQDRVARYGLGFDRTSDSVFQWRSVHATYYTPMDLRAFPFDKQHLLIQMEVPEAQEGWSGSLVKLVPSTTGNALFTAKTRE
eukprot:GHRR01015156.1.p1 GENE.GHRR01015156.1~~GHRR01015156.1.p1  ORF type:complete len:451 (+),score=130.85 GHRR01015156.1:966-2318(+)